jgi:hypothetical protein
MRQHCQPTAGMQGGQVTRGLWPVVGKALIREFSSVTGRCGLVVGAGKRAVTQQVARLDGSVATSVGQVITSGPRVTSSEQVRRKLDAGHYLVDLDVLFWRPWLELDPLLLLRSLARSASRVVAWPGEVEAGTAYYSEPGRRDYFVAVLRDVVILRSRPVYYPDEPPFEIERIPP